MSRSHFHYHNGILHAEGVSVAAIADAVGTPCYVYSANTYRQAYQRFAAAFQHNALVCFAVKSNANPYILKDLGTLGAGADVVSMGELLHALKAGIAPQKIVFSGVGKSREEIACALTQGILQINAEATAELQIINEIARSLGKIAPVAIRVNPDVNANTHAKITTGLSTNKFGIAWAQIPEVLALIKTLPNIALQALTTHIGSQLTSLTPFEAAFTKMMELAGDVQQQGFTLQRLDLGGGLGIAYQGEDVPDIGDFAAMVLKVTAGSSLQLMFEPGRYLVGASAMLVFKTLYSKDTGARRFVIVDAGMNDFMRQALYEAEHRIIPVQQPHSDTMSHCVDIVGPVCESTDCFASNLHLPPVADGDYLAMLDTGAYGSVLGSTYNLRLPAPEVLVDGGRFAVIRQRPTYADLYTHYPATPVWM